MSSEIIQEILNRRKETASTGAPEGKIDERKFFSLLIGNDPLQFFEIKKREGDRISLSYDKLAWFYYEPSKRCVVMEFDGVGIRIIGRGLDGDLYVGIQHKRCAWIKEADSEMEDEPGNETFIEEIEINLAEEGEGAAL